MKCQSKSRWNGIKNNFTSNSLNHSVIRSFGHSVIRSSFCHDARGNVHGLQLLKEQLARVRNFHIREFSAVVAHVAAVYAHLVIHGRNHAATFAHEHLVLVR